MHGAPALPCPGGADITSCAPNSRAPRALTVSFSPVSYLVKGVRIWTKISGYEEIDAVLLQGYSQPGKPPAAGTPRRWQLLQWGVGFYARGDDSAAGDVVKSYSVEDKQCMMLVSSPQIQGMLSGGIRC